LSLAICVAFSVSSGARVHGAARPVRLGAAAGRAAPAAESNPTRMSGPQTRPRRHALERRGLGGSRDRVETNRPEQNVKLRPRINILRGCPPIAVELVFAGRQRDHPAVLSNGSNLHELTRRAPQVRRRKAFADALWTEHHRIGYRLDRQLAKVVPNFDRKKLRAEYAANGNLWEAFCRLALNLDDGRKVPVEALAWIVAALFWTTLLIENGFYASDLDLTCLSETSGRERRRAFKMLWLLLYVLTVPSSYTNSAPTWRASHETANLLLPGAARDWEHDRDAIKHFARRLRRRFPCGKAALKCPQ
jgi:hypothetical protein